MPWHARASSTPDVCHEKVGNPQEHRHLPEERPVHLARDAAGTRMDLAAHTLDFELQSMAQVRHLLPQVMTQFGHLLPQVMPQFDISFRRSCPSSAMS